MCYCYSQIFELCRVFEGFISYNYIMILTCILVAKFSLRFL